MFDNLLVKINLSLPRTLLANNDIYKSLLLNSRAQGVSGKNEQSF